MKCSQTYSAAALLITSFLFYACNSQPDIAGELSQNYLNKTPAGAIDSTLSLAQAYQIQERFVQEIGKSLGPVAGYKAGFTSAALQERFKIDQPVRGTLLQKMLLEDGTVLTANFGIRSMIEADLLVRVGSEAINQAETPAEALAGLDAVIPFIELPDLIYAKEVKLTAAAIVAVNVGARRGVMGEVIPIAAGENWETRLGDFQVQLVDRNGQLLAQGKGSNLLGHPLNVVLWIKNSLAAEGKSLKKGDLLSLGSLTPMMPVQAGTSFRVSYGGLLLDKIVDVVVHIK